MATRRSRSFSFEQLEYRQLMAVTTSLDGSGNLRIIGDATADDIAVEGTANPGEFTITGRNGTTVDGNPDATVPGVTADLILELGDGDNVVDMDNVYIATNIVVTTGAGSDNITLGAASPVSPGVDLLINSGAGADSVRIGVEIYSVFVAHDLVVNGDVGDDSISAHGASAQRWFLLIGGAQNDSVLAYGVTADRLSVTGNEGDNSLAVLTSSAPSLFVAGQFGADNIYIDTVFCAGLSQIGRTGAPVGDQTGQGDLTVTITRSIVGSLYLNGGGGNDTFYLSGNLSNTVGDLAAGAGQGNDNIQFSYNSFAGRLTIDAGSEDDDVSLVGNRVDMDASASGGSGFNRLTLLGNRFRSFASFNF